ncbi:F-box domain-containing protein [Chitinolyticbacter meiyuanensis]|uniref:F-box domain-containing protein n=1 Tax=Chitinolyticbacter meiyuanensis TaxID=682798 RepID=UPI0011E6005F|nr:F-box domain-containing protein [Chitinolyticbacter meiyuanensis]
MLTAILNGKKRGSGLAGLALHEVEGAEDILTSSVFERISYFPDLLVDAFLRELLTTDCHWGAIREFCYWPRLNLDQQQVEPDLLIHAEHSILIEAKRWDGACQQNPLQIANEIFACLQAKYLRAGDFVLVLGGLPEDEMTIRDQFERNVRCLLANAGVTTEVKLVLRSWRQLYAAIEKVCSQQAEPAFKRILNDIESAFAWHDVRLMPMPWLHDMPTASPAKLACDTVNLWRPGTNVHFGRLDIAWGFTTECFDYWR